MTMKFTKRLICLILSAILTGGFSQLWVSQVWAGSQEPAVEAAYNHRLKVYEQMELVSLIMRLAGFDEYNDEFTEYQQSLMPAFEAYANQPVVEFARELRYTRGLGFDAPIWFALHLEKVEEQFQLKEGSAFWYTEPRWTPEIAEKFLELLNDFYTESNFAEFFQKNIPYFEDITNRLVDELWVKINYDWFYQFGFGPEELRITIYPSGFRNGYGPTLLGTVSYAVLPVTADFGVFLEFAVHEFVHSFANPLAEIWYEEDEEFRRLSNASVDIDRMPSYGRSIIMAYEYVTRAYTILYMVENHDADLFPMLLWEMVRGFPYIETVYAMITEHEPYITPYTDMIALALGVDAVEYTTGEKRQIVIEAPLLTVDGYVLYIQMLDLKGAELPLENFEHMSSDGAFNTRTGDAVLITIGSSRYLYIDLGEDPIVQELGLPEGTLRKYSVFPLHEEYSYTVAEIMGGAEYSTGEKQTVPVRNDRVLYYQILYLLEFELVLENFRHNNNGDVFSTQAGDVIIVTENARRSLWIDLGPNEEAAEAWGLPEGTVRKYFVFPIDIFTS